MLTLICGLGILVGTQTELNARFSMYVLLPARTALADWWYVKQFDSSLWQESAYRGRPLPGRHPRGDMLADLLRRVPLLGLSVEEVALLLGPPDHRSLRQDGDYAYYVGPDRGFLMREPAFLLLQFDASGHVTEVEVEGSGMPCADRRSGARNTEACRNVGTLPSGADMP